MLDTREVMQDFADVCRTSLSATPRTTSLLDSGTQPGTASTGFLHHSPTLHGRYSLIFGDGSMESFGSLVATLTPNGRLMMVNFRAKGECLSSGGVGNSRIINTR